MEAEIFLVKFYSFFGAMADSTVFFVIKILLGIYVIVLFLDLVLLLIQRGLGNVFREGFSVGMNVPPELTIRRKKTKWRWEKIWGRLKNQEEKEFKIAIIEADELVGDLVKRMGYQGENLGEIFHNVPDAQIESIARVKKAHEIKNRIIQDENFLVSMDLAKETLENYKAFFEEFEVF